jgi:hypothetical protein
MSGECSSLGKETYYSFCGRPEGKKTLTRYRGKRNNINLFLKKQNGIMQFEFIRIRIWN